MKPIAIVFSDLHINDWSKHNQDNQRTLNHFRVLSIIKDLCMKYKCSALFCGDLFHQPEKMSIDLHSLVSRKFQELSSEMWDMYAITGNHDTPFISTIGDEPRSWLNDFSQNYPWLNSLDYFSKEICKGVMVYGIPYVDHNIGLSDYLNKIKLSHEYKNILLLHTDYPGAKDCDGRVVDSVENLNLNALNRFDLVLCGHIHKPQRLSKKVYMIGAPLQQRRTDKNQKLGYWKLYEDFSMKFVELKGFPKFIDVESEDEIKDDGNYYTIVPKQKAREEASNEHKITKQLTKTSLAKQYLKEKGIKDKVKQNLLIKTLKRTDQ